MGDHRLSTLEREQQALIDAYRAALAATDDMVAIQSAMIEHLRQSVRELEARLGADDRADEPND